jgi:hypothetical protein
MQFRLIRHVVLENVLLFGSRFGLVRDFPVRRVDDAVATASQAKPGRSRGSTRWRGTSRRATSAGCATSARATTACRRRFNVGNRRRRPEALHVGMVVGQSGHGAGRYSCRTSPPAATRAPSFLWSGRSLLLSRSGLSRKHRDEHNDRSHRESKS